MRSGFLVLDKEEGITSHDLISRSRRILGTRRIGHAGTLDPMATGVMVLGIESATRLLDYVMSGRKRYLATVKLGIRTVTDDRMGEVLESHPVDIKRALHLLHSMVGQIEQVPSQVSAVKVDGKRSYERVRSGESVALKARKVEIFSIEVLSEVLSEGTDELDIDVTCSAGTYIRAIARDIGGHLISLRRVESQPFTLTDCTGIEAGSIIPASEVMRRVVATYSASEEDRKELALGRSIAIDLPALSKSQGVRNDVIAVISARDEVIALAKEIEDRLQPIAVLAECRD